MLPIETNGLTEKLTVPVEPTKLLLDALPIPFADLIAYC